MSYLVPVVFTGTERWRFTQRCVRDRKHNSNTVLAPPAGISQVRESQLKHRVSAPCRDIAGTRITTQTPCRDIAGIRITTQTPCRDIAGYDVELRQCCYECRFLACRALTGKPMHTSTRRSPAVISPMSAVAITVQRPSC